MFRRKMPGNHAGLQNTTVTAHEAQLGWRRRKLRGERNREDIEGHDTQVVTHQPLSLYSTKPQTPVTKREAVIVF